jgi:hypothetical protein
MSQTKDLLFSGNVVKTLMWSSLWIPDASLRNVDGTDPFRFSHQNFQTELDGSSLDAFSNTHYSRGTEAEVSTHTVCGPNEHCANPSEASANVGTIVVPIAGTIGGLLAAIAATRLFMAMQARKEQTEAVDEAESGADIGIVETMIAFDPSDQYVSQENMDHIRTGEMARLSFGVE